MKKHISRDKVNTVPGIRYVQVAQCLLPFGGMRSINDIFKTSLSRFLTISDYTETSVNEKCSEADPKS